MKFPAVRLRSFLLLAAGFALLPAARSQNVLVELNFDNASSRLANIGTSGTAATPLTFSTQGAGITYNVGGGINGGTSAVFSGSGWLFANYSPVTTAFSITFWMKTTTTAPNGSQWYQGPGIIDGEIGGVTTDWGISQLGNRVVAGVGQPDITLASTTDINTGTWAFVAATWDSSSTTLKLYVNGTLQASHSGTGSSARRTDQSFFVGHDWNGYNFVGELDQIQFYDAALTPTQLTNLQTTGSVVPEPATTAAALATLALLVTLYRRRA